MIILEKKKKKMKLLKLVCFQLLIMIYNTKKQHLNQIPLYFFDVLKYLPLLKKELYYESNDCKRPVKTLKDFIRVYMMKLKQYAI